MTQQPIDIKLEALQVSLNPGMGDIYPTDTQLIIADKFLDEIIKGMRVIDDGSSTTLYGLYIKQHSIQQMMYARKIK